MVFMAQDTEVTRRSAGDPIMGIDLDASTFDSEVQSRHGGDRVDHSRVPHAFQLPEAQCREVAEAIDALVRAHFPGAAAPSKVHGASRVLSALAGTLSGSASNRCVPVAIQRLKQVEEWVDAHIGEAITLGQLCKVAQASERSLQFAFQARRGMSPMRFVCERRLGAAQRRLFRSAPDENVTAVATSLGFTHLGRFASAYFAAFGESPSLTLMRGRRWAQAGNVAASARRAGGT
jgi:AraC-like DNA-binding protein